MAGVVARKELMGLLRVVVERQLSKEEYDSDVTVGQIEDDCVVFTRVADVVTALNDLNRTDLIGKYEAIFINFSAADSIVAAYGCVSHHNLTYMAVVTIEEGIAPQVDAYGLPIGEPAMAMEV